MSYGKRIFVDGKRPDWFRNKDAVKFIVTTNAGQEQKPTDSNYNPNVDTWSWDSIQYIQLPIHHEVYTALNAGMKPWRPEPKKRVAPEDYDGGRFIRRNGVIEIGVAAVHEAWAAGIYGDTSLGNQYDIVGYEPKVTPVADIHTELSKMFMPAEEAQPVTDACDIHEMMINHFTLADEAYPDFKAGKNATPVMISLENVINSLKQAGILVKPVDPDLVTARMVAANVAGQGGNSRLAYEKGERDNTFAVRTALAAIKATKA